MATKSDLEKLARDYYDRLFRAALFMCGSNAVAEDLVQETYLAAATSLDSFEGRSSVYTWLYGILRNKFRGYLRGRHHQVSLQQLTEESGGADAGELMGDDEPGVYEQTVRRETAGIVREALDALPEHHRAVLSLRYLERMSYKEIADALECSLGTVKSRIHYALRSIAASLGDDQEPLP